MDGHITRFIFIYPFLILFILLTACSAAEWQKDPAVVAAKNACRNLPEGERNDCYERQAIKYSNPDICRLVGMWIDDMCFQMVHKSVDDPSLCDRIYLQGVVPNCRA